MKRFVIFCSLLYVGIAVYAQQKQTKTPAPGSRKPVHVSVSDSLKRKAYAETLKKRRALYKKLILAHDTLTSSDYMMSIERVNDHLNDIQDSAKLSYKVVSMGRRIDDIASDIKLIRQNIRSKHAVVNVKNLYLYQSFALNLDEENDQLQARVFKMYHTVYYAKQHLKTVLFDTIFRKLYADSSLRITFNDKLVRLERKWHRTDSTTKANVDTLNAMKVKTSDNDVNLSNMLNMMESRLDRADKQLFGPEVTVLWQKAEKDTLDSSGKVSMWDSEENAIGYYFSQTSGKREVVLLFGALLFIWLLVKRKLFKTIRKENEKERFGFLGLQFMNDRPVWSLLIFLLCLMPFFDAYAPTSYITVEFLLLLTASSFIFFKREDPLFRFNWLILVILFVADDFTYLLVEPTLASRLWLLAIHLGIIVSLYRFYKKLSKQRPYYKFIKWAVFTGMILCGLGILCNFLGRFSLAGIFGLAGIFAVTQAVVLPVFIETFIEVILLQLLSIRIKKGVEGAFSAPALLKTIKAPLIIIALILWLIMLTSNLNIYHSISNGIEDFLTSTRTIGSISFRSISLLLFFAIIWLAHILQRLVSFLFGETGSETEDMTAVSKGQHSRLLITRLLVLIGGYLLAIAASGLPIDKLTFLLGALGVGIGMGLQNVVNNFVSGIILIFDGSLQIGDEIEVSGQAGKVKEIGLRASTLSTADGGEVIIPNGNILSQNILNWTLSSDQKRIVLEFSLTGKELDANVINEVINSTIKNIPDVVTQKKPVILYTGVAPELYTINVRFWSKINKTDQVKSESKLKLSAAFAAKNIGFK